MIVLLVFAVTLLLAVFVSELAERSVLSTAALFLVAGFVSGPELLSLIRLRPDHPAVSAVAELALFSVLFTDGMRTGIGELRAAWKLPGRALVLGLPLTLIGTALLAHWIVGLPWAESFLVGAVLCPTDPVFAAAIVGREEVPKRLRDLLNVESGLNDGLALPIVAVMLAVAGAAKVAVGPVVMHSLEEVGVGVLLGVAVPWAAIRVERSRFFQAVNLYEPLMGFAVGILVLALAKLLHGNIFLAAFAAGITVASVGPTTRDAFRHFGELLSELLKLAALLVFGSLISPSILAEIRPIGFVFVVLALVAVRPLAFLVALPVHRLGPREWGAAAWFGPKGFASVCFGLLILQSDVPNAERLAHLVAVVIFGSILAHSSTDVVVARWLQEASPKPQELPDRGEISRENLHSAETDVL